ncbi:MAG: serine hydrolase [Chitinophagaceae bacterium]|nr:serine hydrolase [Chitinophagaceae bacterium]
MILRKLLLFLHFVCIVQFAFCQQPAFITDSLDNYITRGMKDAGIPGLSIAIVKDGKVIISKGYGVKEVGKPDPVDENTLFYIASNTKLFTGTSLAKLDAEKKIALDDKVMKYFPDYRVYDTNVSRLITIRDLLSHHLGTKTFQGDFTFWNTNLSRKEIINKMRLLKPSQEFRKDYGYCNSCFLTAGEIIPVVTGMSWEKYIQENILTPLDMTSTYTSTMNVEAGKNIAVPYSNSYGPLTRLPYDRIDNLGPAGSLVSNVKDMSKWLLMQLDSGRYGGKQIIPWTALQKTRDMNTIITSRRSSVYPTHFRGYGLGVFINDYNGRTIYWHTGGADGFVTNTCFVPEEKLGIVILTNNDNQSFFEALRYQVLDAYLGIPYTNRAAFLSGFTKQGDQQTMADIKKLKDRTAANNHPSIPLNEFTGEYNHPLYGSIYIKQYGKNLSISFPRHPGMTAALVYMDNNEFMTTYSEIAYGIYASKFIVANGKVLTVEIKVNPFVEFDPYVFTKK